MITYKNIEISKITKNLANNIKELRIKCPKIMGFCRLINIDTGFFSCKILNVRSLVFIIPIIE
jgi:hypothetical protein